MSTTHLLQGSADVLPLENQSVDLVFCSPPYADARLYLEDGKNHSIARKCADWIDWMLKVVHECCRVSRGLVLVNCAGVTRKHCYWPAPEGLLYRWWAEGGECWRPAYWHRVGIPGSGGKQWLRADIEYVLAFKNAPGPIPWADNTANGHPPKWGPGGEMSHRNSDGKRINQWGAIGSAKGMGNRFKKGDESGQDRHRPSHKPMYRRGQTGARHNAEFIKLHTKSLPDGTDEVQCYAPPVLANPGTLVQGIKVGGGLLGSKLAHENEAPFPEKLAAYFIRSCCPPGGIVLDPFSGSGTTVSAARQVGRIGIGIDLRMSQCELARRRLAEPVKTEKRRPARTVAIGQPMLFGGAA